MPSESHSSQPGGDEPRLSWRDRELLAALRRLANAQAQLQSLEAERSRQPESPTVDSADVETVEALEAELSKLREKASHRFGRASARDRLSELEAQQRLVLERLGFDGYRAFAHRREHEPVTPTGVDPALVDFARHELEAAEEAYAQVLEMPDDLDDPDPADAPSAARAARTIDLTARDAR
jgi:hypothetical protein